MAPCYQAVNSAAACRLPRPQRLVGAVMGWTLLRSHQREFLLEYVRALKNTPQTLRRMAFRRRTLEEELSEVRAACVAPLLFPAVVVQALHSSMA